MAGHLARNQVHAGSIPAAQTEQGTSSNGRTRPIESAAEWSATGPENRGGGEEPQRFDSSALGSRFNLARSANSKAAALSRRRRGGSTRTGYRISLLASRMSRSSSRPRTLPPQGGDAGPNPARDAYPPGKWTAARTTNPGSGVRIASGGRHWRRAGVVTGRFATPWPTTVARVRFAPSPLLRSFAPLDRNR